MGYVALVSFGNSILRNRRNLRTVSSQDIDNELLTSDKEQTSKEL